MTVRGYSLASFSRRQWFAGLAVAVVFMLVVVVALAHRAPTTQVAAPLGDVPSEPPVSPLGYESHSSSPPGSPVASVLAALPKTASVLPGGLTQLRIGPDDTAHPSSRSYWGDGWIDADGDCQNTRAEVLIAESTAPVTFSTSSHCSVVAGRWVDPWSGSAVTSAAGVQIDHDVPLAEAWRSGAWAWTNEQRLAYANDLTDEWALNALTSGENDSKSDRDPARWRPPLQSKWCLYAKAWTTIKAKYQLTADQAEWDGLLAMAQTCPA
jgi:hypothetical protein